MIGRRQVDSRSALVKSVERAAKQQELSDGYRALFGESATSPGELGVCFY